MVGRAYIPEINQPEKQACPNLNHLFWFPFAVYMILNIVGVIQKLECVDGISFHDGGWYVNSRIYKTTIPFIGMIVIYIYLSFPLFATFLLQNLVALVCQVFSSSAGGGSGGIPAGIPNVMSVCDIITWGRQSLVWVAGRLMCKH